MPVETPVQAKSDGNLAATYALIFHFLRSQGHEKAATALKKSVKDVVVLREDIPAEAGLPLDEIVKKWKIEQEDPSSSSSSSSSDSSDSDGSSTSSSSDSDSDDESSSDSSSDESDSGSDASSSSSDTETALPAKKTLKATSAKVANSRSSPQTSTKTLSSGKPDSLQSEASSDSESAASKASSRKSSAKKSSDSSSSSGSDSDSDSSSSSDPATVNRKPTKKTKSKKASSKKAEVAAKSDSSSDSTRSSDSGSSSSSEGEKAAAKTKIKKAKIDTPKTEFTENLLPTKRRKTSESGTAVITAATLALDEGDGIVDDSQKPQANLKGGRPGKPPRKINTPFQRIKVDAVEFADDRLMDNSFTAKGGSANDYGERANRDLIVTRGAGFRKEKNKKKKGSYRGGEITMQSHSIKFNY